jgi:predicted lactoylglutathione lyase
MDTRISVTTLGVSILEGATGFYELGLGFKFREDISSEFVAFFQMNGFLLGLYLKESLAHDAGVSPNSSGFPGVTLAQNVGSTGDVDQILKTAFKLVGKITKCRGEKPGGLLWLYY